MNIGRRELLKGLAGVFLLRKDQDEIKEVYKDEKGHERVRIYADGRVGIGTTPPDTPIRLSVRTPAWQDNRSD